MIAPDIADARFGAPSPILQRLLSVLKEQPQTKLDLEWKLWGTKVPAARNNLSHHIWRLNELLKPMGYRVSCRVTFPGRYPAGKSRAGRGVATYCLVSCPPSCPTKPAWKVFDPDGIYIGF